MDLPGPVGPDEPDPLAGPEVERQVGEQRAVAVALGQPLGTQQDAHAALAAGFGGARVRPDHPQRFFRSGILQFQRAIDNCDRMAGQGGHARARHDSPGQVDRIGCGQFNQLGA